MFTQDKMVTKIVIRPVWAAGTWSGRAGVGTPGQRAVAEQGDAGTAVTEGLATPARRAPRGPGLLHQTGLQAQVVALPSRRPASSTCAQLLSLLL